MIVIRNNITSELVKKHLNREAEEHKAATSTSSYRWGPLNIYFYEWSNLNSTPRHFTTYFNFFRFCVESNIVVTNDIRNKLYGMDNTIYVVCKQDKPELLFANAFQELQKLFNECQK